MYSDCQVAALIRWLALILSVRSIAAAAAAAYGAARFTFVSFDQCSDPPVIISSLSTTNIISCRKFQPVVRFSDAWLCCPYLNSFLACVVRRMPIVIAILPVCLCLRHTGDSRLNIIIIIIIFFNDKLSNATHYSNSEHQVQIYQ